jgi:hypothetical protein
MRLTVNMLIGGTPIVLYGKEIASITLEDVLELTQRSAKTDFFL